MSCTAAEPAVSTIVRTTAAQLRALGVKATGLVAIDEKTLRVSQRRGGFVVNTDVELTPADLYNVTVRRIDMRAKRPTFDTVVAEREYLMVYAEQLADVVGAWR